jgi:hypothetical protein
LFHTLWSVSRAQRVDLDQARAPAIPYIRGTGSVGMFSFESVTSGIPRNWAAGSEAAADELLHRERCSDADPRMPKVRISLTFTLVLF